MVASVSDVLKYSRKRVASSVAEETMRRNEGRFRRILVGSQYYFSIHVNMVTNFLRMPSIRSVYTLRSWASSI